MILGWQGGRWEGESEKHRRACIYPPLPLSYIHISVISFPIVQHTVGDDTPIYIHEKEFWWAGVERGVENVRALHIEHICETSNHHVLGSSKIHRIKFCLIVSSDFFFFLFSLFYPNQHFVVVCSTYICRVFFFFFLHLFPAQARGGFQTMIESEGVWGGGGWG